MKTWYIAECKKCMEAKYIMVTNPTCTAAYLSHQDRQIQGWLEKHYGCELILGHSDHYLDSLWEQGYTNKDLEFDKI